MYRPSNEQPLLPFDELPPIVPVHGKARMSLDDYFRAFHEANPHVYVFMKVLALQALSAGRERIGAKLLVERLRWEYAIETVGSDFKIDNSLTSRYSRLLAEDPDLSGLQFELRELRS